MSEIHQHTERPSRRSFHIYIYEVVMKRRSFLRMLGFVPIVAATPSIALPTPDNPKRLADGGAIGAGEPRLYGEIPSAQVVFDRIASADGNMLILSDGGTAMINIRYNGVEA